MEGMATVKRVSGDYSIVSVNDGNVGIAAHTLTVDGNLVIKGTTNQIDVDELKVVDPWITLGVGNTGTFEQLGIEVVKGPGFKAGLRWNTATDQWEISKDNVVWVAISTSVGTFSLYDDPNPTLSADLDLNSQDIFSPGNIRLVSATENIEISNTLLVQHRATDPDADDGYTKVYAKEMGPGGTGLYISCEDENDAPVQDELVSRSKAIIFSIIF